MTQGVPRNLRHGYEALHRALSRTVIDRLLHVETADIVDLADLGLDAPHRGNYEAGGWLDLVRVLRPGEVGPDDVFLDFGSGKGRILLVAARYCFARIIGVESPRP
jgi:hypothetical protein